VAARRPTRVLTRIGVGAAALAAVVLGATPAFAISGHIASITPQPDGHLAIVFAATDVTTATSIDPASVTVTINGQQVPATAKPITDTAEAPVRTTLLVMDVSGSMQTPAPGQNVSKIAAAKSAADAYLRSVPNDVLVGLVTFGDTAVVRVAPTTDRAKVGAAVNSLSAGGSTALYDAVVLADRTLGTTGLRSQLLLTDGTNEGGTVTTLAPAVASIKASGTTVDAVSLGTDPTQVAALTALTRAGDGTVVATNDTAKLAATFESVAQSQASQVLIDVAVPTTLAGSSQNVTVTASAGGQTIGDSVIAIMPAASTGVPTGAAEASYGPQPVASSDPGVTTSPWFLPVALGAFGIGVFVLLAVGLVSTDRDSQTTGRMRRRLSRYSLASRPEPATIATSGALGQSQIARSAVDLAGRVVQRRDLDTGLGGKLEAAGVPLRPAEWMLIHVGIAIAAALVLTLLSSFNPLATVLGLVLGLVLPFTYLTVKEGRRKAAFAAQLPGTLQLLAGSLAAGYSLPQAIDAVTRDAENPMAAELNRTLVEARLGVPIEDALESAAHRMDSVDFSWVVMAIRIQREVGGNLAEVLSGVAATMRERERLRRQVQVLSAEGRLSAVILGALPILFAAYLVVAQPQYVGLLVTTPLGVLMIVVGAVLLVAGAFWLRKVVSVEV
jgi:tight adherence protein B